jgi:radical SAM-linked protein
MSMMREERIDFLAKLGAEKRALPVVMDRPAREPRIEADERPAAPQQQQAGLRYRFRYEKTGATALLGHLDIVREIPRVFRRVGVTMVYTRGFHPKPDMSFGPALSLGVMSLDEYVDIRLARAIDDAELAALVDEMSRRAPAGLVFRGAARLGPEDPSITKVIAGARYVIALARSAMPGDRPAEDLLAERCAAAMAAAALPIRREIEGIGKMIDVRSYLLRAEPLGAEGRAALARAGLVGDLVGVDVDSAILASGAVKAAEIAAVLAGDGTSAPPHRAVRAELFGMDPLGRFSPLTLGRGRKPKAVVEPPAVSAIVNDG